MKWKDVKKYDIIKYNYIRKGDNNSRNDRNEIIYAVVERIDEDSLYLSDIACNDLDRMERYYDLSRNQLTNRFQKCTEFRHKFLLLEIISFQDKLKAEHPEYLI